ncbi:DUF411 domain-containing protein [Leucothrix pacifica]|jgi:hypothetical protein|nr:DUF411 domain-containing protein [Leucothrix pacifica]
MKNKTYSTTISALLMTIMASAVSLNQVVHADDAKPTDMSAIDTSKVIDVVKTPQIVTTDTSKAEAPKALPLVTVYKSATCGCCSAWIDHMKDNGFPVEAHNSDNLNEYKVKAKLGASLGSCHTAFVDGYAIEGHVPANDIKRLLSEKPDISGLTAPGMPMNSPGMAPKGSKPSGYDVISFKDGEAVGVFTKY